MTLRLLSVWHPLHLVSYHSFPRLSHTNKYFISCFPSFLVQFLITSLPYYSESSKTSLCIFTSYPYDSPIRYCWDVLHKIKLCLYCSSHQNLSIPSHRLEDKLERAVMTWWSPLRGPTLFLVFSPTCVRCCNPAKLLGYTYFWDFAHCLCNIFFAHFSGRIKHCHFPAHITCETIYHQYIDYVSFWKYCVFFSTNIVSVIV